MSFRTIEITGPAELHVKTGSLVIEKEIKRKEDSTSEKKQRSSKKNKRQTNDSNIQKLIIPLDDIRSIVCMGAGIRISTMAMAHICRNKISMTMLDEAYRPAGILTAYEANVHQSLTMRKQVKTDGKRALKLWKEIVKVKILNQADLLDLLNVSGAEKVRNYAYEVDGTEKIDMVEARAARQYFDILCPDIKRTDETPMNSRLNYGYAVIRNSIIRAIVAAGLLPSFGIHHQNLYNAYNLADDLIEPFRPCVDMIACKLTGDHIQLPADERKSLASVLQYAVNMNGQKTPVIYAIDQIVSDYRKYVTEESETISIPRIMPEEIINLIRE